MNASSKTGVLFESQFSDMLDTLAFCLLVEDDEFVQRRLRPGDAGRYCVRAGNQHFWIEIGGRQPAVVHRLLPLGLAEVVVPLADIHGGGSELLRSTPALAVARKRASAMLLAYVSETHMPGRTDAAAIMRWAPAIEMKAYSAAAMTVTYLEFERQRIFPRTPMEERSAKATRRRYWAMLSLMGRYTLLSTSVEARGWLAEMVTTLNWVEWTPSWALLRERSLWLAMIAARAAASVGDVMADRYLEILRRERTPMKKFDALFGLTAIALSSPANRLAISAQVRSAVSVLSGQGALTEPTIRLAAAQALEMIADPAAATEHSNLSMAPLGSRQGFFNPELLSTDAADPTTGNGHPAFNSIPAALGAPVSQFFPASSVSRPGLHLGISDVGIRTLTRSAWNGATARAAATIH
jgi:hypothetical protein